MACKAIDDEVEELFERIFNRPAFDLNKPPPADLEDAIVISDDDEE